MLVTAKQFVRENPELFRTLSAFYMSVRAGRFTSVVYLGRKMFVDLDQLKEWRKAGGTPLKEVRPK